jgi:hypothetical protein
MQTGLQAGMEIRRGDIVWLGNDGRLYRMTHLFLMERIVRLLRVLFRRRAFKRYPLGVAIGDARRGETVSVLLSGTPQDLVK